MKRLVLRRRNSRLRSIFDPIPSSFVYPRSGLYIRKYVRAARTNPVRGPRRSGCPSACTRRCWRACRTKGRTSVRVFVVLVALLGGHTRDRLSVDARARAPLPLRADDSVVGLDVPASDDQQARPPALGTRLPVSGRAACREHSLVAQLTHSRGCLRLVSHGCRSFHEVLRARATRVGGSQKLSGRKSPRWSTGRGIRVRRGLFARLPVTRSTQPTIA